MRFPLVRGAPLDLAALQRIPLISQPVLSLDDESKNRKQIGYYARPSAAVEQGGAFYVPGLEGFKLRIAVALLLLATLVANRLLSPTQPLSSQLISEMLGAGAKQETSNRGIGAAEETSNRRSTGLRVGLG